MSTFRPPEAMLSIVEKALLLMEVDVFSDLSSEQVARIAARTSERRIAAGQMIPMFEKGLFYVVEGRVELLVQGSAVRHFISGMTFGLAALLGPDVAAPPEARAAEDSHLLYLPREDFMDTVHDHPEVAVALLRRMSMLILDLFHQLDALQRQVSVPVEGAPGPDAPRRDPLA